MTEIMECCRDRDLEQCDGEYYVCQNCGIKWSPEKAKRVINEHKTGGQSD